MNRFTNHIAVYCAIVLRMLSYISLAEVQRMALQVSCFSPKGTIECLLLIPPPITSKAQSLTGFPSIDKPWLKYYSEEQKNASLDPIRQSAFSYIFHANQDNLYAKRLFYYGRKYSFREIFDNIEKYRIAFLSLGIKPSDIVTFATVTTPELIFSFYALNRLGAIANLVDPRTQAKELHIYLTETHTRYLFGLEMFLENLQNAVIGTQVKYAYLIDPLNSASLPLKFAGKLKSKYFAFDAIFRPFSDFLHDGRYAEAKQSGDFPYQENYPAAITHTGGTTGIPKGVLHTNENFNAMAFQFRWNTQTLTHDDVFLNVTVPFVAFGIINAVHFGLVSGCKQIIIPNYVPEMGARLIKKYDPTYMIGAPSYFEGILKINHLKRMKYPIAGAEAAKPQFEQAINDHFRKMGLATTLMKGYGMTEVSACATVSVYGNDKFGSVGIPLIKTTVSIFDPDSGKELPYGQSGEICVTGPGMMKEYYNNPEETQKMIRTHDDGQKWVHSGDIGYMDEEGFLYITDRIKRILTIDGFKVYPSRLETILLEHHDVASCSVIGIPNDTTYKIVAFIVSSDNTTGHHILRERLEIHIKDSSLPTYYYPADYVFHDILPLTNAGKIDVLRLQREYQNKIAAKQEGTDTSK